MNYDEIKIIILVSKLPSKYCTLLALFLLPQQQQQHFLTSSPLFTLSSEVSVVMWIYPLCLGFVFVSRVVSLSQLNDESFNKTIAENEEHLWIIDFYAVS